ncbi:DUF982 domain-containing protein [Labrys sp. KB_33_2]|uniref:DUF982 domain-containing protein n=1 Tax=Labrys sp. KB_33_2 TaxID=3237479 RepID=UPI003F9205E7
MEHASFSQPVEVKALAIAGADQAATYLFEYWPVVESKCYELAKLACIDAQRACLDVMAGAAQPDQARGAFVEACKEADMRVMP